MHALFELNLCPRSNMLMDFTGPGAVASQQAWNESFSFSAEDRRDGGHAIALIKIYYTFLFLNFILITTTSDH